MRNWIQSNFLIRLRTARTNLMALKWPYVFSLLLVYHLAEGSPSMEQMSSCNSRVQLGLTTLISLWAETSVYIFYFYGNEDLVLWDFTNNLGSIALRSMVPPRYFTLLWAYGRINLSLCGDARYSFTPIHQWALKDSVIAGQINHFFFLPSFPIK